jgi:nitroreductase
MTLRHRQADEIGFTPEERGREVETRYPVLPELLSRWSPRSFAERPPETDKLASIFEAARLAPSAHNSQPSRFIVGRRGQGTTYERLFSCLDPHNQLWAHAAPVLVLGAVAQRRFSQATGDFVPYAHCMHDLGLAVMSLIVQAQHLGLHCHPMAAFDPDRAQSEFAIPPLYMPGIMIALGYLGSSKSLPETVRAQETAVRIRRQLEELVFEEDWGQAAGLFAAVES